MKISIKPNMMMGYANLPSFNFKLEISDDEFAKEELYPYAEGKSFLHIPTRDGKACTYQSLCWSDAIQGNPNFAWGEFKSGWASRASVINTVFDKQYVDCGGKGLDVRAALEWLHENYTLPVAVSYRVGEQDIEYLVAPWTQDKTSSFEHFMHRTNVMNPTHPDFICEALHFLELGPAKHLCKE